MAKAKQTKLVQALTVAQVAHNAMLPILTEYAKFASDSETAATSRSELALNVIRAMWETTGHDVVAYHAACVEVFGNRIKTKDGAVPGTLKTALVAANVTSITVRSFLSHCRDVAEGFSRPDVQAAADKSGLRAAYKVTRPKVEASVADVALEPKAALAYSQAVMVELVAQHFDDALFAVRAYLLRAKDAIAVSKVSEIEIHMAGKTKAA